MTTKKETTERRNANGKDDEEAPWKGGNVDRRVEARNAVSSLEQGRDTKPSQDLLPGVHRAVRGRAVLPG